MANLAFAMMKGIGLACKSLRWIRSWPVRHHLGFIALFAWIDSRSHVGRTISVLGALPFRLHQMSGREIDIFLSIAAVLNRLLQKRAESWPSSGRLIRSCGRFGPATPGWTWPRSSCEVDAIIDFALARHAKHFLRAEIILEGGALLVAATGCAQIIHRFLIDREKTHGRAVFRRHVADRGAIRHWQRGRAFAVKLDKLSDYFLRAQHLGDVQDEIGRGHAFAQACRSNARPRLPA